MTTAGPNVATAGLLIAVLGLAGLSSTVWAQTSLPPPPPTPPQIVAPPVSRSATTPSYISPFVQATFGELRRTYTNVTIPESGLRGSGNFSDIEGVLKGGVQFQLSRHFMIAPAVGGGFNLWKGRGTLLAEAEFDYTGPAGGFAGVGFGSWDLTNSDNRDGTVLVHGGVPLVKNANNQARLLFVAEGRLFTSRFDDISNNYQYGAGFRWVFR